MSPDSHWRLAQNQKGNSANCEIVACLHHLAISFPILVLTDLLHHSVEVVRDFVDS
jgi:hypothetical protein